MQVRELRQKLESLAATLSTWDANSKTIENLTRLTQTFVPFDDMTVAAFCKQLDALNNGTTTSPRSKSAPKSHLDTDIVEDYVATLSSDALNYAAMQTTLTQLRNERRAKVPELTAIASQLAGSEAKFRNKKSALEKIEAVVRRRLDTGRRLEGTSGIF